MASSFLSTASKRVTDVRGFLRDAATSSSIKYAAEKGAKHILYIPYTNVETEDEKGEKVLQKQIIAISGAVHEWHGADGKYKATVCMKDVIRQSEDGKVTLNDGSCPICNRVSDAWDIYRYRKELEEVNCKLTGEDKKKHLETVNSVYADERKAKDARTYMYVLVAKMRTENNNVVLDSAGVPEYDLKVMKLSSSRVEKLQQQVANAGSELAGSELMFEYPNTDDRRLQVSQSTTALVFPNNMVTTKYPALMSKIVQDVNKFDWEGIEKSFPEWAGMTTAEAEKNTNELFEKWDEYKKEVQINPAAKYMEYITDTPVTNPSLNVGIPAPTVAIGGSTGVPNLDVNEVFGASATDIQTPGDTIVQI